MKRNSDDGKSWWHEPPFTQEEEADLYSRWGPWACHCSASPFRARKTKSVNRRTPRLLKRRSGHEPQHNSHCFGTFSARRISRRMASDRLGKSINHLVPKQGQAARKASRANSLKFSCIRAGLSSMYFTTTLTACPLVTPGGWHTSAVSAAIVSTIPRHWPRLKASSAALDGGVSAVKERQPGIM
jgi:hypothetical protein